MPALDYWRGVTCTADWQVLGKPMFLGLIRHSGLLGNARKSILKWLHHSLGDIWWHAVRPVMFFWGWIHFHNIWMESTYAKWKYSGICKWFSRLIFLVHFAFGDRSVINSLSQPRASYGVVFQISLLLTGSAPPLLPPHEHSYNFWDEEEGA